MVELLKQLYPQNSPITSNFSYTVPRFARNTQNQVMMEGTYTKNYSFKTEPFPQEEKLGVMLVGYGGNNGTTFNAALISNKFHAKFLRGEPDGIDFSWRTREATKNPTFYGSMTQSATIYMGEFEGKPVYVPFNKIIPMVHPDQMVVTGWDISNLNMYEAMIRAQVLEPELVEKLRSYTEKTIPLPSIYYPDFIASNQSDRANNVLPLEQGKSKWDHIEHIRNDIKKFKADNNLKKVVVMWTANTERYAQITPEVNQTWEALEKTLKTPDNWDSEIAPSTCFAIACLMEGVPFINGSPQNTYVPGLMDLAEKLYADRLAGKWDKHIFIAGDDFKTGQTKFKSCIVEFLVGAGIKPMSLISYNHLGNNDGKNLNEEKQFKSKEKSKSDVVMDIIKSNPLLYNPGEKPDHLVVIKYDPYVGDSKRALDEFTSEIGMGGKLTYVVHQTCEDSLLAYAIILDLITVSELFTRIQFCEQGTNNFQPFHPVLSFLAYWCKAPLFQRGIPAVNGLNRQRQSFENFLKMLAGLPLDTSTLLEYRAPLSQ